MNQNTRTKATSLEYVEPREAWYNWANDNTTGDVFNVRALGDDGAFLYEFMILDNDLGQGNRAIKVNVYSGSFGAYVDFPLFFEGLSDLGLDANVESVRDLLVKNGAVDVTEREVPEKYRASMEAARCSECGQKRPTDWA